MTRWMNTAALTLTILALGFFASRSVRADDSASTQPSASAATQPSDATGSITVTVLDSSSNPVHKATVRLYSTAKPADADDNAAPAKPKAVASGKTDEDGKFTFPNLATGDYRVRATMKKTGGKGSADVAVSSDTLNPTVTITFAAPADSGGATTAPSAAAQ
jgi:hypothetical protein